MLYEAAAKCTQGFYLILDFIQTLLWISALFSITGQLLDMTNSVSLCLNLENEKTGTELTMWWIVIVISFCNITIVKNSLDLISDIQDSRIR